MLSAISKIVALGETFIWNGVELDARFKFLKTICDALNQLLWPILIVVATVGSIYAIYLGINMARAEDASKRDEAKKRVVNAVISMVVVITLILLIQLVVVPNMASWIPPVTT